MPQHQDLHLLGGIRPRQQDKPAEQTNEDEIQQCETPQPSILLVPDNARLANRKPQATTSGRVFGTDNLARRPTSLSETCATQADDAARPAPAPALTATAKFGAGAQRPDRAPSRPNLITNIATTARALPDSKALEGIHQSQQRRGLLPGEHYLDSGYPSAELITGSLARYGVALITPVLLDTSRQARSGTGLAASQFTIDWEKQQATCPAGKTSTTWNPVVQEGVPKTVVSFAAADCIPCPLRDQCTSAKSNRRQLSLHPREMTEALRQARAQQQTKDWNTDYALRAGVEGTIRQSIADTDMHHARYRGLPKTHLEHLYSAVALNLLRLHAWWNGHALDRTRTTHLARLELSLAA